MECCTPLQILERIRREQPEKDLYLIAIDGRCGAGKSTLGTWLAGQLNCPLIHMDDFYLRPEQRTPRRLQETGGNVDYERFVQEVLAPLQARQAFSYRPLLCPSFEMGESIEVPVCRTAVIEGSYAFHPRFEDPWDLKIFMDIDPDHQQQRILARSSPEKLAQFNALWIPKEEAYFSEFHTADQADCSCRI